MRTSRLLRTAVTLVATAAIGVTAVGAGTAHAALVTQAAKGSEIAVFIRSEWWPQAKTEVGFPVPGLKKVVCPSSVPATTGDPATVLRAALSDLAAGDVAPTVDDTTGVFTCVGRLDGQRLLIAGALNEAGDARFATASLILAPDTLAALVAGEVADRVGPEPRVVCSTRDLIVAQPDVAVRCTVKGPDAKGVARVVLDGQARVVSVDFARK